VVLTAVPVCGGDDSGGGRGDDSVVSMVEEERGPDGGEGRADGVVEGAWWRRMGRARGGGECGGNDMVRVYGLRHT
jgi:hypothetical protein